MADKVWNVALRPNTLTPDNPSDCIAVVKNDKPTRTNEDIAKKIVEERSEYREDTILNILNMRDKTVKGFIEAGESFRDGLVQASPRVSGVWENSKAQFDAAIHRRTLDLTITQEMKNALDAISVNVVERDISDSSSKITLVTNSLTGEAKGTMPIGDDVIIEGDKIKIQDEADSAQGVFFVDEEGKEHKVTRKLTDNKPSRLTARVPADLTEGSYKLVIRTKFSTGKKSLKDIREITYSMKLTAVK